MRIGLVAPPWVPVPPVQYGGTEEVVDCLARGLTRLGHEVRLFTVGESTCEVARDWYFERAAEPMGATLPEAAHVLAAYDALRDVDLIHDHTVLGPLLGATRPGAPPVVATNHGTFGPQATAVYRRIAEAAFVVAISRSQRASAPDVPVAAVIHHGIDLVQHAYGPGDGGYALFIGRMSPDKGVHRAIDVARRAGRRLVIVTRIHEEGEVGYFEAVVRPLLGDDVDLLVGPSTTERVAMMQGAVALLNPISWPEPFGLVMAEALACGTPVIASPRGAAPEIVDHGRTGFLYDDQDAMVAALGAIHAIDRRQCRLAAEARFDMRRMAEDHAHLYERLLAHRAGPRAVTG